MLFAVTDSDVQAVVIRFGCIPSDKVNTVSLHDTLQ